jgi:hypothetical protein
MSDVISSPSGTEDDMISLAVPRRHYGTLVRALADAMSAEERSITVPATEETQEVSNEFPQREWSREDVQVLKRDARNPTIRAIFDMSVDRRGKPVSIREVERYTGRTYEQVRGDLAGLTQTCKRKFGRSNWPFNAEWAADGKQQFSYRVPTDVVQWWREG